MPLTIVSPHSAAVRPVSMESEAEAQNDSSKPATQYRLYARRWLILFIFSGLAFLNNLICYSLAPVQPIAKQYFSFQPSPAATDSFAAIQSHSSSADSSSSSSPHHSHHYSASPSHSHSPHYHSPRPNLQEHLNGLVTEFFLTYVIFSFPSSYFIDKFGLRSGILLGCWMQTLGCWMRTLAASHDSFYFLHLGQLVASLGQAFFVNPPSLVAESFFGPASRTFATTVAVNSNSLGIAGAYLLGPFLVKNIHDIPFYLQSIFYLSAFFAVLATLFFTSKPPTPPSFSQAYHSKTGGLRLQISWSMIVSLFSHRGFLHTLMAFALAEATINAFSAFMNSILVPSGFSNTFIGMLAVTLIVFCMIGSAIFGFIVDRTHHYKATLIVSLIGTGVGIVFFIFAAPSTFLVAISVCVLGFFLGALQPISLETAVEVSYPSSASTVTAILQVIGNLASAALFPLFFILRDQKTGLLTPALWTLAIAQFLAALIYLSFNGKYLRRLHETGDPEYFIHEKSKLINNNNNNNDSVNNENNDNSAEKSNLLESNHGDAAFLFQKPIHQDNGNGIGIGIGIINNNQNSSSSQNGNQNGHNNSYGSIN